MKNIHLDYTGNTNALDFQHAQSMAQEAARQNQMKEPTTMAWHADQGEAISPRFDGGNPAGWWQKYGEGNGGRLHVDVGGKYQFMMMDTRGFEAIGPMPVRNLLDRDGQQYLCFTPLLGNANTPNQDACMPLDDWLADQY